MKRIFYKTIYHFFPAFSNWLKAVDDPRSKHKITYATETLLWTGILLFVLKLEARRQINFNFNSPKFIKNLSRLSKQNLKRIPDDDTLAYLLTDLEVLELYNVRAKMINRLLRNKCLARYRLYGYYLIAIDGTGYLTFKRPHCPHCLVRREKNKVLYYYHPVVEAKIVTSNGLALSIETEFVENLGGQKKQDCELKAFHRLVKRLKKRFPQLKVCLLLDALYANEEVLKVCQENKWKYFITFKKGSLPETYQEYEALKKICKENTAKYNYREAPQIYHWVNDINYKFNDDYLISALECWEYDNKKHKWTRYLWITNFRVDKQNYHYLTNRGARLRWKTENEGFNIQKNGGYNLEHPYSHDFRALKNFYLLMQIAHIINQLIERGSLLTMNIRQSLGSIRNIAKRLLEELRTSIFDIHKLKQELSVRFQIRLDTS